MPSGYEIPDFYVEELPHWVNVIAITKEGLFVLEEQYRHGIQKVCFELPSGVLEIGEEPILAAKRELAEETGYSGGVWVPFGTYSPNASGSNNTCYTFLARGVEKATEPNKEQTEDIITHLVSLEEISEMLLNGRIVECVMQAPLWRFLAQIVMT